jgi:hypothetical protein
VIRDFSISYVTHGTLNAKKSNAILMVTAISGNHHRIDFMIGPGKALDPENYFIICTDAIGNGLTAWAQAQDVKITKSDFQIDAFDLGITVNCSCAKRWRRETQNLPTTTLCFSCTARRAPQPVTSI